MRALARGLGRAIVLFVQIVHCLLLAEIVPMLALAIVGEKTNTHGPHWVAPAGLAFWAACFLIAASWAGRARRRARAARWTPPPPPPGQPMPEPVEQWPEVAGYAVVRRLPDGSVVIQPSRGQNVA